MKESQIKDWKESFKKIAAGIIITLLTLMMGSIMFLPGSVSDYTNLFTPNSIGSFAGHDISRSDYSLAYNNCKERYAQYNLPEAFINNCAKQNLKEIFVIPAIGSRLGLEVSERSIKNEIANSIKKQYQEIQKNAQEEDRLSVEELYQREMRYLPLDSRKRLASASHVGQTLMTSFPYPESAIRIESMAESIVMDMDILRFNNSDLLQQQNSTVEITAAEIEEAYKKEIAGKDAKEIKPLQERENSIRSRLKSEKKQKELSAIKEKLSKLEANPSLEKISELTGIKIEVVKSVPLSELASIKTGTKTINLALPEFLAQLKPEENKNTIGPITDEEFTIYLKINSIKENESKKPEPTIEQKTKRQGSELAGDLIRNIVEAESLRNKFQLQNLQPEPEEN